MNDSVANARVSVVTPTWNRARYLERVWAGLSRQTNSSFEWIVANDGSNDDTVEIVKELAAKSTFPVTLIDASVRVGKSCMDNLLVEAARGQFIIWCDSDDVLHPDALDALLGAWDALPIAAQRTYMGVTARSETDDGVLGQAVKNPEDMSSWNALYAAINSDLLIMARADLLKENRFLEVDYLIPETSVWNVIGVNKSVFLDRPLAKKHYGQPFALSFTGKMQYSRGRAYALASNYPFVRHRLGLFGEFFRGVNYVRYCSHGDVPLKEALRIWQGSTVSDIALVVGLPLAFILILRDRLRGVVEKTHLPFNQARTQVQIAKNSWPGFVR